MPTAACAFKHRSGGRRWRQEPGAGGRLLRSRRTGPDRGCAPRPASPASRIRADRRAAAGRCPSGWESRSRGRGTRCRRWRPAPAPW